MTEIIPINDYHKENLICFEHQELVNLMFRSKRFETVDFTDANERILTPEIVSKRYGPDGGIDCVIRIVAPTETGAKNVAGRIRNIIIRGDYEKIDV